MAGRTDQDKDKIQDYAALVEVLKTRQIDLSPRLQDVAAFFLNHPEDVAILTIVEIARAASVPPSAVTRFSQALGFDRFSDLQAVFQQRLVGRRRFPKGGTGLLDKPQLQPSENDLDLDDPMRIAEILAQAGIGSLNSLVEDLQEGTGQSDLGPFVQALREAEAVHIIGNRGAFGVACYAFYGFSSVGKRSFLIDNFGAMRQAQLQSMGPKDVLLAISFDDYTPETLEIVTAAQEQDHAILAITDNELSPLWKPSQHRLLVKEARLGHFRSQVPAMVLLQTLILSVGRNRLG